MTARDRFLSEHGECHEVTGVARDGIRQTLRRFFDYGTANNFARKPQPNFTDLRVRTLSDEPELPLPHAPGNPVQGASCASCRNKLLWAGEAHCTVDNRRHRLVFSCRSYAGLGAS